MEVALLIARWMRQMSRGMHFDSEVEIFGALSRIAQQLESLGVDGLEGIFLLVPLDDRGFPHFLVYPGV